MKMRHRHQGLEQSQISGVIKQEIRLQLPKRAHPGGGLENCKEASQAIRVRTYGRSAWQPTTALNVSHCAAQPFPWDLALLPATRPGQKCIRLQHQLSHGRGDVDDAVSC